MRTLLEHINSLFHYGAEWCEKHPVCCWGGLFLLSLGLKALVWYNDPLIGRDAAFYLHTVREWADSGVMPQSWIPPMLFCLIRGGMFFGLDPESAGVTVNLLMGAFTTLIGSGLTYEITRNKKITLIAAVFFVVHPGINALSHEIQRDVPYLCFAGIAAWTAIAGLKRKKWFLWAVSGAFAALAFVTRYETAELFPLIIAALPVCAATRLISWKQSALYAVIFFAAAGLSLAAFIHFSGSKNMYKRYSNYYTGKYRLVEKQFLPPSPKKGKGDR